jgi:hypothetical protein
VYDENVYSAVRTGALNKAVYASSLKGYKNQSVYAVSGKSRCLSQVNTNHINKVWAELTVVNIKRLVYHVTGRL